MPNSGNQRLVASKDYGVSSADQTRRKIRPIVLEESPVNLAESISIEAEIETILANLDAFQLVGGTPDGTVLVVNALYRWVRIPAIKKRTCPYKHTPTCRSTDRHFARECVHTPPKPTSIIAID